MYNTFNPEQSDDDEMRWHCVECEGPTGASAVLCGSEGGAGSDAEKSELTHSALLFFKRKKICLSSLSLNNSRKMKDEVFSSCLHLTDLFSFMCGFKVCCTEKLPAHLTAFSLEEFEGCISKHLLQMLSFLSENNVQIFNPESNV